MLYVWYETPLSDPRLGPCPLRSRARAGDRGGGPIAHGRGRASVLGGYPPRDGPGAGGVSGPRRRDGTGAAPVRRRDGPRAARPDGSGGRPERLSRARGAAQWRYYHPAQDAAGIAGRARAGWRNRIVETA